MLELFWVLGSLGSFWLSGSLGLIWSLGSLGLIGVFRFFRTLGGLWLLGFLGSLGLFFVSVVLSLFSFAVCIVVVISSFFLEFKSNSSVFLVRRLGIEVFLSSFFFSRVM